MTPNINTKGLKESTLLQFFLQDFERGQNGTDQDVLSKEALADANSRGLFVFLRTQNHDGEELVLCNMSRAKGTSFHSFSARAKVILV